MATNRIKIEVDYEKAIVKVNDLKLKFDELGERVTATRNRIKNAVKDTKDAIDGSVKSLMREKQEWQNVQASLSTTNEQYRKYQVQIDKIDAQIKRLTDTRSKERSVLAGSVTALEAQISKLKTLQNNLSTTNRQYREAQVAIDALRKRVEAITDTRKREEIALKNSAAGIQQQINLLKQEQANRTVANKTYRKTQEEIDRLQAKLDSLTDTRKEHEVVQKGSVAFYEQEINIRMQALRNMNLEAEAVERLEQEITSLNARKAEAAAKSNLLSKAMAGTSSSAGAAGATVTEFGRTIGDAPFGLMGMANNLQQLSQQFVDLQTKSGGTKQAIQSILTTMMGPAGFVVAINVVTSAIVAYNMRKDKAKEKTEEFNSSLLVELNTLKNLSAIYKISADNLEDRIAIVSALAAADKDYADALETVGLTEEDRNKLQEDYFKNRNALNVAEEKRNKLALDNKELLATELLSEDQRAKLLADIKDLEQSIGANARQQLSEKRKRIQQDDELIEVNKKVVSAVNEVNDAQKQLNETLSISKIYEDRLEALEDLAQATFDLRQRMLDKEMSDLEESGVQTVEARRKVITKIFGLEMERLEAQRQKELENITDQATIDAINKKFEKLSEIAAIDFREQLEGAIFEPLEVEVKPKLSLKELLDGPEKTEAQEWAANELAKSLDGIDAELAKRVETTGKRNPFVDRFGVSEQDVLLAIDTLQQGFQSVNDVLAAQADREIAIETNKTNALNDELRRRLANEQLSADQRDQINQQIARNQAALVEKENAIKKKRFEQQKAFNIAMAVIDTYVAANQALKDETLVSTFAKVAAMVSIIGTGLANVASISKQEFTGKPLPAANLSSQGGGTAIAAPSFNVVGQSTRNQIADAVSSALSDQVLRAYVVSSDVTTAQELDRKIVEGASI